MAKNKLSDLNDHLFAQLERLNDETITPEQMQLEFEKAKAMEGISRQIIDVSKLYVDQATLKFKIMEAGYTVNQIPTGIENENPTS